MASFFQKRKSKKARQEIKAQWDTYATEDLLALLFTSQLAIDTGTTYTITGPTAITRARIIDILCDGKVIPPSDDRMAQISNCFYHNPAPPAEESSDDPEESSEEGEEIPSDDESDPPPSKRQKINPSPPKKQAIPPTSAKELDDHCKLDTHGWHGHGHKRTHHGSPRPNPRHSTLKTQQTYKVERVRTRTGEPVGHPRPPSSC